MTSSSLLSGVMGIAGLLLLTSALHAGAQIQAAVSPSSAAAQAFAGTGAGAVAVLGPGDTLAITVLRQPDLSTQVTIDADGNIIAPFLGKISVFSLSPSMLAQRIADGLRDKGYLRDPQVLVEVLQVRSQVVSLLGEVMRPGRYPIAGHLSLLELLAEAGGLKDGADEAAIVLRKVDGQGDQQRLQLYVGQRDQPSRAIQDAELHAGDVVYIAPAPRIYVYGEVQKGGAYPMEPELTVMRALSLAGGLTQRGSKRRIVISRTDPESGQVRTLHAKLVDPVKPGDVIRVDERFF